MWRSIFWNIRWIYRFLYPGLLYNFYAINFVIYEKYGMLHTLTYIQRHLTHIQRHLTL